MQDHCLQMSLRAPRGCTGRQRLWRNIRRTPCPTAMSRTRALRISEAPPLAIPPRYDASRSHSAPSPSWSESIAATLSARTLVTSLSQSPHSRRTSDSVLSVAATAPRHVQTRLRKFPPQFVATVRQLLLLRSRSNEETAAALEG